eukprot:5123997-Pyramimonas_sp.AAC.1
MTKQERIIHTTRELNSTVHTANVPNFLRLTGAPGKRVGRGGSGSARKWDGATASQDRTLGAAPASSRDDYCYDYCYCCYYYDYD